jgi:phosphatidylglycerophosphate synthase
LTAPKRIQENLTAGLERRLLNWICQRLPLWWTPDRLTALGFFGAVLIAVGYAASNWGRDWLWLSVFGYCLNWFGDSLDGSVARYRKIERPNYGYFIDHSLDALANTIFIIGMGLSPYMRMDTALFGLAGYLLLSIHLHLGEGLRGDESHLFGRRPHRSAHDADRADYFHVSCRARGQHSLAGRRAAFLAFRHFCRRAWHNIGRNFRVSHDQMGTGAFPQGAIMPLAS